MDFYVYFSIFFSPKKVFFVPQQMTFITLFVIIETEKSITTMRFQAFISSFK